MNLVRTSARAGTGTERKRHALVAFLAPMLAVALLLGACAPKVTDVSTQLAVQVLSVSVLDAANSPVTIQGRNFGDGVAGGQDANYVLFTRNSDSTSGQRLQVNHWSTNRIEVVSPEEAGNGFLVVVAGGVAGYAFPVSLP